MPIADSVRAYMRIHPQDFLAAVRLLVAYAGSLLLKIAVPSRFRSVGLMIPGWRNLRVMVDRTLFEVRPRTNDLDLVSERHEPVSKQWFQVDASDVVIDVGSHIGWFALTAAVKGADVFAIEPDSANFAVLRKNVTLNHRDNVVLSQNALSSGGGTVEMFLAEHWNTGTSSVRSARHPGAARTDADRSIRVPSDTLDHLVELYGLQRIDWLKVDVEGHEIEVLEGGALALAITRRIILEVTQMTEDRALEILRDRGFDLVGTEPGNPASNLFLMRRDHDRPHATEVRQRVVSAPTKDSREA